MPDHRKERPSILLVTRCFVKSDGGAKILILKRAATDRHLPGRWECPGGKLEKGQNIAGALEAETMQETGLLVHPSFSLSYLDSHVIEEENKYEGFIYVVFFGITRVMGGHLKLSHEHDEYAWVDYDEMLDYDLTDEVRKAAIVFEDQLRAPTLALVSA